MLQHGTILLDVDVKRMFSVLKVPNEKLRDKIIKKVEDRVTSLKNELGRDIGKEEVMKALVKGFEDNFSVKFVNTKISAEELELAKKLYKDKYSSQKWNYWR